MPCGACHVDGRQRPDLQQACRSQQVGVRISVTQKKGDSMFTNTPQQRAARPRRVPTRLALATLALMMVVGAAFAAAPGDRSGEQVVKMRCATCHQAGEGGAPRIGDKAAWIPRLKDGLDGTVRSAIRGHGGMPARGGMAELTDAEVRSAVIYMYTPAAAPAR
jgi:cytochrome c5